LEHIPHHKTLKQIKTEFIVMQSIYRAAIRDGLPLSKAKEIYCKAKKLNEQLEALVKDEQTKNDIVSPGKIKIATE
jgi:7-keto-8-aminopelargonate synthetase-like enzyme